MKSDTRKVIAANGTRFDILDRIGNDSVEEVIDVAAFKSPISFPGL